VKSDCAAELRRTWQEVLAAHEAGRKYSGASVEVIIFLYLAALRNIILRPSHSAQYGRNNVCVWSQMDARTSLTKTSKDLPLREVRVDALVRAHQRRE